MQPSQVFSSSQIDIFFFALFAPGVKKKTLSSNLLNFVYTSEALTLVKCGMRNIQNVVSKVGSKTLSPVEGTLWLKDTSEGSLGLGVVHSFLCAYLSRKGKKVLSQGQGKNTIPPLKVLC